jgi:hypothetical protein
MQELIKQRKIKCVDTGCTFQPSMFEVCEPSESKKFFLTFDTVLYQFPTFVQCLDICFQTYQVMNLQYPRELKNFWIFIQREICGLKTEYDTFSPCVSTLVTKLNIFNI